MFIQPVLPHFNKSNPWPFAGIIKLSTFFQGSNPFKSSCELGRKKKANIAEPRDAFDYEIDYILLQKYRTEICDILEKLNNH